AVAPARRAGAGGGRERAMAAATRGRAARSATVTDSLLYAPPRTPARTRAVTPSHQCGSGLAVSIHQVAPAAWYGAARPGTAAGPGAPPAQTAVSEPAAVPRAAATRAPPAAE